MTDFNLTQLLKHPHYGLLSLVACLFSIYLVLIWRIGDMAHFGMSLLFFLAVSLLAWERHACFRFRYEPVASFTGIGLIAWMIWQSKQIVSEQQLQLYLFPFTAAVAVALIASGFQALKQYRSELTVLLLLGIPSILLHLFDISPLTASASAMLLTIKGLYVTQQGTLITLTAGTTEVYSEFSGMEGITYLVGAAIICSALYPVRFSRQVLAVIAAIAIGFSINAVRVAILATLAAPEDQPAFLYWYEGEGALLFGFAAFGLFALLYWFLVWLEVQQYQARSRQI